MPILPPAWVPRSLSPLISKRTVCNQYAGSISIEHTHNIGHQTSPTMGHYIGIQISRPIYNPKNPCVILANRNQSLEQSSVLGSASPLDIAYFARGQDPIDLGCADCQYFTANLCIKLALVLSHFGIHKYHNCASRLP
jgi:hypothetical protein